MTTRIGWAFALLVLATAGCQSSGRAPGRPLAMLPPAPLDDTPRPKAIAGPRAEPGTGLSTASEPFRKFNGQEEASFDIPVPPAPSVITPAVQKVELAPPPPLSSQTSSLPPTPTVSSQSLPPDAPAPVCHVHDIDTANATAAVKFRPPAPSVGRAKAGFARKAGGGHWDAH